MTLWVSTKARVVNQIEAVVRRLTGQESPTYIEKQIISDAFNTAIIDICMDAGVSRWRFIQADETCTTTASTQYADLDTDIFNIVSGTVRIEAEDANLYPATLEFIYSSDPGRDDNNTPIWYALDSSTDPETIRMVFKPIPDAVYTVSFVAETIPDEDAISSFPSWAHGMLQDKATAIALKNLGLFDAAVPFELSFRKRRTDNKNSQGFDTPQHIRRAGSVVVARGLESRLPD